MTVLTLQPKPVERASEFIATLRSLRSSTIQPEVAGSITRIFVKAGDRVRTGTPLVQIDPDRQQAAVQSTEANRSGAEADVQYWRQQVTRLQALVAAGAISRQEFEQAQNSLKTAEAKLATVDAQVSEDRVRLRYYRVVAPHEGIVGDIAVRPGDRVSETTVITTIDENSSLEAYIQVPLERAPDLRLGLPVQMLDADGKVVAQNPISFVAPRVDDVDAVGAREEPSQGRAADAAVAAVHPRQDRVEHGTRADGPGRRRPAGQRSSTSASSSSPRAGLVARQRPVQVGEIIGNDYVVKSGVKAGDRVVISGVQKLADDAPVKVQ